ncbi:hypothetical protein JMJ58_14995 [Haloterrigena salifodinae]|uniref:Uncharacterized protein n=1 Tax=Haloterrigena salifodinae TaxID=2675099 RepID=A0A8T8DYI7_9EURY|nr:hypothetical protein [Haloterrigena salifodinae]QRV14240.1 hypothetical protein JMJ58_14995 [Haloterrigena salifodinae]
MAARSPQASDVEEWPEDRIQQRLEELLDRAAQADEGAMDVLEKFIDGGL